MTTNRLPDWCLPVAAMIFVVGLAAAVILIPGCSNRGATKPPPPKTPPAIQSFITNSKPLPELSGPDSGCAVGDVGTVSSIKVQQVIDGDSFLCWRGMVDGVSTDGMADGVSYAFSRYAFHVSGTQQYRTALGTKRTVFVLDAYELPGVYIATMKENERREYMATQERDRASAARTAEAERVAAEGAASSIDDTDFLGRTPAQVKADSDPLGAVRRDAKRFSQAGSAFGGDAPSEPPVDRTSSHPK